MVHSKSDADDDEPVGAENLALQRRMLGIVLAVALFGLAMAASLLAERVVTAIVAVGRPGTVSELVSGVVALQIVGLGGASLLFLMTREQDWRSYLRLGPLSEWTLFYGVAVGLGLMILTSVSTVLFALLNISPPESSVGQATGVGFYVVLLVVSTAVVVPAEELFFRGVIQRYLSELSHPAVGIAVASLCFASVHASVRVGDGGELLALSLFVLFGLVLGASYHLRENLLVPIIGHGLFNGVQIFVRTLEVLA
jgi:membrane protease YdiL (CAAX protease family)